MQTLLRPGIFLVLLGLFALPSASADDSLPARFPSLQISEVQWTAYRDEVRATPGVECKDGRAYQFICNSSEQHTIWTFTREGHHAHPAVSRAVVVMQETDKGPAPGIDRSSHYAGNRGAFDDWVKDFAALDKSQVSQWRAAQRK